MKRMSVLFLLAAVAAGAVLILTGCNSNVGTSNQETNGSCGENLQYSYDKRSGTLTISGTGEMTSRPWRDFKIQKLVLEEGITSICDTAFYGEVNLKGELVLPSTLKSIGEFAFYDCTFSGDLVIPEGVERIEESTFDHSSFDGKLTLPSSLKYIGKYAFHDMKNINGKIHLPDGLETIEYCAFNGCEKLTGDLIIPNSVTMIGGYAFQDCGFDGELKLSENLEEIPLNCFYSAGFKGDLIIPDSVKTIGDNVFLRTGFDGQLKLSENLEQIGVNAFSNLKELKGDLVIPENVTMIHSSAFSGCSGFSALSLPTNLKYICDSAFSGCSGFSGELQLPEDVKFIGDSAFAYCTGLIGVLKLPEGLTSIGDSAFSGCEGFSGNLILPESLINVGTFAFSGCENLSGGLNFPEAFAVLRSGAFLNCKGITEMSFGSGIRSIGSRAAAGCEALTSVKFDGIIPDFYSESDKDEASFPENCDLNGAAPNNTAEENAKKILVETSEADDSNDLSGTDRTLQVLGDPMIVEWTWLDAVIDDYRGAGRYSDITIEITGETAELVINDHTEYKQTAEITADRNDESYLMQLSGLYVDDMRIEEMYYREGYKNVRFLIAKGIHPDGSEENIYFCSSYYGADQYLTLSKDFDSFEELDGVS